MVEAEVLTNSKHNENSRLKAALRSARRGWRLIPLAWVESGECSCGNPTCASPAKHPLTRHGIRDATTDPIEVHQWWTKWPAANIGVVTGRESGVVVVDVDVRHNGLKSLKQLKEKYGPLPDGPRVRTGGGGLHFYFSCPLGGLRSRVSLLAGIDLCADGKYVVAPPGSHISGNKYLYLRDKTPSKVALPSMPAWLLELISSRPQSHPEARIPAGERNSTLISLAGMMRHRGMSSQAIEAALLEENRQRCDPGLSDSEVRAIAKSISRYAPRESAIHSAHLMKGVEEERKFNFRTPAEIASSAPPRIPWVAQPWVATGTITEVTGKIKAAGKTSWVNGLVRAVLDGNPFMGQPTRKTRVVYLSEERLTSFREALKRADLLDRKDLYLLFSHETYGHSWASVVRAAVQECRARKAGLLVVDTFAQFAGLAHDEENIAGAVFQAVQPLQEAAVQDLAVLIVHHERKSGGPVSDAGRGSSAIGGAADILIRIRRPEGNQKRSVRLIQAESRFSETPSEILIELTEDGYKSLGEPGVAAREQSATEVLAMLPEAKRDALTMEALIGVTGKNRANLQRLLDGLLKEGRIRRTGEGRKGDPFRYFAA